MSICDENWKKDIFSWIQFDIINYFVFIYNFNIHWCYLWQKPICNKSWQKICDKQLNGVWYALYDKYFWVVINVYINTFSLAWFYHVSSWVIYFIFHLSFNILSPYITNERVYMCLINTPFRYSFTWKIDKQHCILIMFFYIFYIKKDNNR